ncbi:hypothetical protein H2201_002283 [Coniosporium apollinis]|uniref:Mediator of RNA polymerase II transcription subunit 1 n=1 Tax=Coniosporium apollinis TaxID=61459 RepID=A0ABQ9P4G3_9PEZI|nr:hypothetical protein H2201_002283 [Coniosporium apollinis]
MATPTNPSQKPPLPPNAATPNFSSHLAAPFSSPAPRSVPSPATHRSVPATGTALNASTVGSTGSGPATGPATGPGTGPASVGNKLLGSSPAGMTLNFDSPSTMNLLDVNMGVGGVGMGLSMSGMSGLGLGLGMGLSSSGGRNDEEDVRKRLLAIIERVGSRPGLVSEEGVERVCRRLGLDWYADEGKAAQGGRDPFPSTAGTKFMLELDFSGRTPSCRELRYGANWEGKEEHAERGKRILQGDLRPEGGKSQLGNTLDRFAANLGRLASLNRLSTEEVDCFEVVAGVYVSLKRLFEHEKKAVMALLDTAAADAEEKAEREVMCKRSGRPRMNAGRTLGLSLQYWMDRRHIRRRRARPTSTPTKTGTRMDVDQKPNTDEPEQVYSLTIECESSPAELYPPIRRSDAWISDAIEKSSHDIFSTSNIDWLEPPPTYETNPSLDTSQAGAMSLDGNSTGKLPNVRFVARLNPPLVVPLNIAGQIHNSVGTEIPPGSILPTMFEDLLLRRDDTDAAKETGIGDIKEIRSETEVFVAGKDGAETKRRHVNSLFVPKSDYYGCILEEVPFRHPREIVEILPILRQYAFLNSLLRSTFPPTTPTPAPSSNGTTANALALLAVDITLSAYPTPTLTFVLPPASPTTAIPNGAASPPNGSLGRARDTDPPAGAKDEDDEAETDADTDEYQPPTTITLQILSNADVLVVEQNIIPALPAHPPLSLAPVPGIAAIVQQAGGTADEATVESREEYEERKARLEQRMARALDVCGEVGVWVEWVSRVSGEGGGLRNVT